MADLDTVQKKIGADTKFNLLKQDEVNYKQE
jgi:hypothetical protein